MRTILAVVGLFGLGACLAQQSLHETETEANNNVTNSATPDTSDQKLADNEIAITTSAVWSRSRTDATDFRSALYTCDPWLEEGRDTMCVDYYPPLSPFLNAIWKSRVNSGKLYDNSLNAFCEPIIAECMKKEGWDLRITKAYSEF